MKYTSIIALASLAVLALAHCKSRPSSDGAAKKAEESVEHSLGLTAVAAEEPAFQAEAKAATAECVRPVLQACCTEKIRFCNDCLDKNAQKFRDWAGTCLRPEATTGCNQDLPDSSCCSMGSTADECRICAESLMNRRLACQSQTRLDCQVMPSQARCCGDEESPICSACQRETQLRRRQWLNTCFGEDTLPVRVFSSI